ncbi:DUF1329 domain-containing protein [Pseudomonas cavernae]|uniref:DUF1329 domain-containing protein n=1 Tax=Pseudomonas cavernae TaxID=2320867 RepID=A0A385Z3V8_9PSED|nr:DUF1329 domain-containing protein [Pseudomonas cavernae]AYC33969.1 DUF1329 domain-containing protein [Pseudomonas cavernae]
MKRKGVALAAVLAINAGLIASAHAKVSPEEAAKLGKELTCVGAERAGNADGSIPEFTGKYLGEVPGWPHKLYAGDQPIDPYANEKPILVITAQNVDQYAERLSDGQKAMFKRYPETYKITVYPGHRDFRYPDYVCDRAKNNALNAELENDGMGIKGLGQVPFPIPKSALEVLWNHLLPVRAWTEDSIRDIASVQANGQIAWGSTWIRSLALSNDPKHEPKSADGWSALVWNTTLKPERDKGAMTIAHEPYNYATSSRRAWGYNPGTRRVRLSPGFGFDQPMPGTNGTMILDEDTLFNGSPERYDWKLLGKREMYVPANTFKANSGELKYADILTPNHPNPDVIRYELRRVWVVEADLREGYRHLYSKRTLFIDEDTWSGVMADNYDAQGELWKFAIVGYYYHPDMSAWQSGSAFYHDLSSGQYVGYNMSNEAKRGPVLDEGKFDRSMYTADAIRGLGR